VKMYSLEELESHLESTLSRPLETQPVSPLRLASYLNNPRADPSDVVLIEMRQAGKLLAYRTLLPDHMISSHGHKVRFAWLSGNWVHPGFRRKGLSTRLLESAQKAWEGRLMYTNYAPASKAVYDRSKSFREAFFREGKRFYLRADTEKFLGQRMGGKRIFRAFDGLLNQTRKGKLERLSQDMSPGCSIEQVDKLDKELRDLISTFQKGALFQRDAEIFNWALTFPWITDKEAPPINYHFSYQAGKFENLLFRFRQADTGSTGLLWMVLHNRVLSAPYVFAEDGSLFPYMAECILQTMIANGSTHATLRNPELTLGLQQNRRHFLMVRNMPQRIFTHVQLAGHIPEDKSIHDGDGDVMFTG